MRTLILSLAVLVVCSNPSFGATRTWKHRNGSEIKAEFTGGVLNNKIVLKAGNQRIQVRLSELSLEDRDYLVDLLTSKKNEKDLAMLRQLMLSENQIPVIDPDVAPAKPANGGGNEGYNSNPNTGSRFSSFDSPNLGNQPTVEVPTEMYGLPLPSPELLVDAEVRTWTNLTGIQQLATFDRVLAPGFLRLKKADGTKGTFALVNFSKADIDYVKEALQKDMAREVFPEGNGFQSLTPEDIAKGYKVWNDRKNVPLIGKFVGVKTKNVVIEVAGEEREYPKAGLSQADRDWVDAEVKRRAEAAQQQAAQQQAAARNNQPTYSPFGNGNTGTGSSFGGHGENGGSRFGSGIGSSFPTIEYSFTCEHCGRTWKDSSPISQCSNCAGKFHFTCNVCGHKWTRTDSMISECPQCAARKNSGTSGFSALAGNSPSSSPSKPSPFSSSTTASASPKSDAYAIGQTVGYILGGLVLLGAIAAGLFKAFG